eukprot:CCRYP_012758-RA/>CCRYP_012758-RA protein AED:0.44 eAED:0.44 QI:0/0/0/1/1/1/2/0/193
MHSRDGLKSCPADPDLWLKEQTDQKGIRHYPYILCYVDDLLMVHHNPKCFMDRINSFLPLKPDSVGPPEMYLGAKLRKKTFEEEDLRGWHNGVGTVAHQLIGILRWMCELVRIDICIEVSMLSSYSAMPGEGHLEAALHVFLYLKSKRNSWLIFDPMEPDVGGSDFVECDWSDFYPGTSGLCRLMPRSSLERV